MKTRILVTMLLLSMTASLFGCSLGEVKADGSSNKLKGSDEIVEESSEDVAKEAEEVIEEVTVASAEPSEEPIVIPPKPTVGSNVVLDEYALEQDKSEEYGVNSTSCNDAYQFLNEDGSYKSDSLGESGKIGNYDYTGRFAYPVITDNNPFKECKIGYRSDNMMVVDCYDENDFIVNVITIKLSHDQYIFTENAPENELVPPTEEFGTISTEEGEKLVLTKDSSEKLGFSVYLYTLGPFTVQIQYNNDTMYTLEELQDIAYCIMLQ